MQIKKRILAVILGNLVLGVGIAMLRISGFGNDPFCASNMALSDGFHVGLGNFQLGVNIVLFVVQLIWGRKYIGFGSIVNLFFLGYIVQYAGMGIEYMLGAGYILNLAQRMLMLAGGMIILTFGLGMYQVANLGVSPYDYLSIGMTNRGKLPYFGNRMITDCVCVAIILVSVFVGFIGWENSHLGIGTVIAAFCLGPLVDFFSKIHAKWILSGEGK